jgi:hypothetical protein
MPYIIVNHRGERIKSETPGEAVSEVTRLQLLPDFLTIWEGDVVEITFEELQQRAGHDPLDISVVNLGIDALVIAIDGTMRCMGLSLSEDGGKRETYLHGGPHSSLARLHGNPCAKLTLRLTTYGHLAEDPRPLGPTRLRELVDVASNTPVLSGWGMVHSECSNIRRIPGDKPWRDIEMFVSRPRAEFDTPDSPFPPVG